MKKENIFLHSKKIYKIDKITEDKFLISSLILMENSGRLASEFIKKFMDRKKLKKVIIFCGPGKNGGDGFVVARYLYLWNFKVKVITFSNNYKGSVLKNFMILKKLNVKMKKFCYEDIKKEIVKYDVVIDSIFGIGLKRSLDGEYKQAVEIINDSKKIVFSIDIPTGIHADSGKILGYAVKANFTLTFGFLKLAFKNKFLKKYLGKIILFDIGYPKINF